MVDIIKKINIVIYVSENGIESIKNTDEVQIMKFENEIESFIKNIDAQNEKEETLIACSLYVKKFLIN